MNQTSPFILHVVLPVPVRHHFDYLADSRLIARHHLVGSRVCVPFGRDTKTGMIIDTSTSPGVKPEKLKKIIGLIDTEPLLDAGQLELIRWASEYYHYPLGDLVFSTLPVLLRQGHAAEYAQQTYWKLTTEGSRFDTLALSRAPKQKLLMEYLKSDMETSSSDQIEQTFESWRSSMKALEARGLVKRYSAGPKSGNGNKKPRSVTLNREQEEIFTRIREGLDSGTRFLLDGITGSGKTELYIEAIRLVTQRGLQALTLVPEIGLTPQFIARFRERIDSEIVVLHSGLTERERLDAWLRARDGSAGVILGTRSAVWAPLANPGIYIVDEEHDLSYKQQEGLRYSARDIAVLRANRDGVPIILGSATPSLESLNNARRNRFTRLTLGSRARNAAPPRYRIIDMRGQETTGALSAPLIHEIGKTLQSKKQVLLFQNRRGYSNLLMCHDCGWIPSCHRCDIPLTFHKSANRLICHHCNHRQLVPGSCSECNSDTIIRIGHGTERLHETLDECFPWARILRIDRDSTRRKGAMREYMEQINGGDIDILVGTQMLSKGHHFPGVTLVGIIDGDRGLYSNDFRASEKMAQLIVQVSGRAGRADDPGQVIIQTHFPEHPFLTTLINNGYNHFAELQLKERMDSGLPPFSYQGLIRADSHEPGLPGRFLEKASALLKKYGGLSVFGPFPAPIEKRAGRYRFQLLIQAPVRSDLHKAISPWINELGSIKESKKVRWSLDIDPMDLL